MEEGREVGDVGSGDGADDVGKLGSEVEELSGEVGEERKTVDGVKLSLEVPEDGDSEEKIRDGAEANEDGNGNDGYGMKNGGNVEQVKGVGSGSVEVNANDNVEVEVEVEGTQSDEVSLLKVGDVKEEVRKTELSNAVEEVQRLAACDKKEMRQEEISTVNGVHELKGHDAIGEFQQLEKATVKEGTDNQDAEIRIDDAATGMTEHSAIGEFQPLEKPVVQEGTDNQDAEIQIDDAPSGMIENNAIGEFQQLEKPVVQEGTDNQDAEVQIDDDATVMTESNSSYNMENVPPDPIYAAKDKEDHTKCLELPVAAECQAEAVLTEGTVNGVLGADVSVSNVIVESDGEKLDVLSEVDFDTDVQPENGMSQMEWALPDEKVDESKANNFVTPEKEVQQVEMEMHKANEQKLNSSLYLEGDESGTEEEQVSFFREVETFFKARGTDFRPPKFYGEPLNLLKLWRAVIRLGGYEQVTSCKLWRQIGESFNPPKTCTTVSWTFRLFYEKALLEFEKHKMRDGDLPYDNSFSEFDTEMQSGGSQGLASGRVMRDSAARAMQGWHSQRALSNGEIGDPVMKDNNLSSTQKREKLGKSNNYASLKRKPTSPIEHLSKVARSKSPRQQMEIRVIDAGEPANWVKINVRKTKDCFEIYALVPGLMREEVRVQSDPAGRLVISGEPQQLDNPWGVTPFKKVVSLPSRIDPHQTSAVVTLHGQLFVRVPFEQLDGH